MKFLHVGCGLNKKDNTTDVFSRDEWEETRLDIDPDETINADIIASITDMSMIKDGSYDAVYSAHNIEHLYPYEVPIALKEFQRVLNDSGIAFIRCPDLLTVAEFITQGKIVEAMYESPGGPVTPIDALYGFRPVLKDHPYMAHKCGFTPELLANTLKSEGFGNALSVRFKANVELFAIASIQPLANEDLVAQMNDHLQSRLNNTKLEMKGS